ncbi:MAG: terminase [Betaproteobacteria bacterium]|nr:terminase [Betaproteobacteria bacterium]
MTKTAKPAPRKTGRPSKYTEELAAEIAQRLSDGEPLRQICRDAHMPHWTNIYEWMARDQDLSVRIARAREIGQDAIAEEIYREMMLEPEREERGRIDPGYVQLIKARAEIKLKLLAKWNPKRYGDRVTMAGDAENPLQVKADVSIFDAMLQNLEAKRQLGDQ